MDRESLEAVGSALAQVDGLVESLRARLDTLDHEGEESALVLAAMFETACALRDRVDEIRLHCAELAMGEGLSPRVLDWSDGTPG
jgi:hypothetical protein